MHNNMATKKCNSLLDRNRTEFMLHISQRTIFNSKNTLDYTEFRLKRMIELTKDSKQQILLVAMLTDYTTGSIVIAWEHGKPICLRVTKDSLK